MEGEIQDEWPWNGSVSGLRQNREPSPLIIRVFMIFFTSWQFFFNVSNRAMNVLIAFCHKFLSLLADFLESEKLKDLLKWFPSTYSETLRVLGLDSGAYTVYVLCPKCNLVYNYDNCIETNFGRKQSKKCTFVNFPRHPQRRQRDPCNTTLLTEIFFNNEVRLIPKKIYPHYYAFKKLPIIVSRNSQNFIHLFPYHHLLFPCYSFTYLCCSFNFCCVNDNNEAVSLYKPFKIEFTLDI